MFTFIKCDTVTKIPIFSNFQKQIFISLQCYKHLMSQLCFCSPLIHIRVCAERAAAPIRIMQISQQREESLQQLYSFCFLGEAYITLFISLARSVIHPNGVKKTFLKQGMFGNHNDLPWGQSNADICREVPGIMSSLYKKGGYVQHVHQIAWRTG